MKLNEVSLLVALNISQWTARKYDKKASEEVAKKYGVYDFVGRYNKSLLPLAETLTAITNYNAGTREVFYANTLPYTYEGVRLLPSKNYFDFLTLMNSRIDGTNRLVDMFIEKYPEYMQMAETLLHDMYNPAEYPSTKEIRSRFRISLSVSPVPDGTGFYNVLSESMAKSALDKYVTQMESTTQTAMRDCWERLHRIVSKFTEKLSEAKQLRQDHVQSMLDNAQEMCELLEKLNITNDPNLEALRLQVKDQLCVYGAAALSTHDVTQEEVRAKADAILRQMNSLMGVNV